MKKIIYSIEGNIGSGKSTLLKAITKSIKNIAIVPEPIESWQHVNGFNLLDKYYQNPVRWGFTFQSNCILSRMTQLSNLISDMNKNQIYISQRSVQADKFIFAKLMHKLNNLSQMQYRLYLQMFDSLQSLFNKHSFNPIKNNSLINNQQSNQLIHKYMYLRTSPEKCFQRIKKRNRFEESKLQFSYIQQIHHLHQEWLMAREDVLVLEGETEFQTEQVHQKHIIHNINQFISNRNNKSTQNQSNEPIQSKGHKLSTKNIFCQQQVKLVNQVY